MNHEVFNQPPPLVDYNLFSTDRALREAVAREGAGWACAELEDFGRVRIEKALAGMNGSFEEAGARRLAEGLAIALQASLLVRHSPAAVADAFCDSRLAGDWGRAFGTLAGLIPDLFEFG